MLCLDQCGVAASARVLAQDGAAAFGDPVSIASIISIVSIVFPEGAGGGRLLNALHSKDIGN